MESLQLDVPAMYGDHHVTAVRGLLLEIAGVHAVYASSSFHFVDVRFDPEKTSPDAISDKLAAAGYLDPIPIPTETDTPASEVENGQKAYFRHTAAYAQTGQTVTFAQELPSTGRPLWPCPGIKPVRIDEEEVGSG